MHSEGYGSCLLCRGLNGLYVITVNLNINFCVVSEDKTSLVCIYVNNLGPAVCIVWRMP